MTTSAEQTQTIAPEKDQFAASAVVIEARGIEKSFRLPVNRVNSLKERITTFSPFSRGEYKELHALRGIDFDIRRGEFFGIVGRNGSGKSTLLKILASIYAADAGRVRMTGRLAPFIELGVGFNQELTARDNIELNGVMMGLSRKEARGRLDAVLDFAELGEFVDMKLKNYSSGMLVRLAFSVMIQSDAEILLIDEVLAVGDASFQQKCADVFHEIRDSDRTVILVTHDMAAVEHYCHRAMLLHDGVIKTSGDPGEVARSYLRLNFEAAPTAPGEGHDADSELADITLLDAWVENAAGERATNIEAGTEMSFHATLVARRDVAGPTCGFSFHNADGVQVTGFMRRLSADPAVALKAGERLRVSGPIENRFAPGRYVVKCWVYRNHNDADLVLHTPHVLDMVVFGDEISGVVDLEHGIELETESR
ncbi:MAG TPA: ABC transporter ATP-binding protein [Solirubrobacterales bacterium]|jgi:ABC-type polysaccharide/polyol phosphate transport system ATPase subunit|nr:ABC transporter ATP-binding protein [Solirubrobacterales bacterium]